MYQSMGICRHIHSCPSVTMGALPLLTSKVSFSVYTPDPIQSGLIQVFALVICPSAMTYLNFYWIVSIMI